MRCKGCQTVVGWTYLKAWEGSQKYKEGEWSCRDERREDGFLSNRHDKGVTYVLHFIPDLAPMSRSLHHGTLCSPQGQQLVLTYFARFDSTLRGLPARASTSSELNLCDTTPVYLPFPPIFDPDVSTSSCPHYSTNWAYNFIFPNIFAASMSSDWTIARVQNRTRMRLHKTDKRDETLRSRRRMYRGITEQQPGRSGPSSPHDLLL